jgi:pyrophosphatase PpaX
VLFDLDGTLIDSGPMIMASARHAAWTVLGRELDGEVDAAVRATIGGPGLAAMMETIDPARVDELIVAYRLENERLHDTLTAFADVVAVLPRLKAEGRKVGIVTAKRRATVDLAFHRFPELRASTDVLVGAEDTRRHKPHPDPILEALARLDVDPAGAAYVGDSPFDIRAARAAGVLAIAVAWGGIHRPDTLLEEAPDHLVASAAELLDVL